MNDNWNFKKVPLSQFHYLILLIFFVTSLLNLGVGVDLNRRKCD